MKLKAEQLAEWFFTANPKFPAEALEHWLVAYRSPPAGTRKSEFVTGMKQGISDTITKAEWKTEQELAPVEGALLAKGLPSIREMTAIVRKTPKNVLKRGRIKDVDEFYVVHEILSKMSFDLAADEREKLAKLSVEYEQSLRKA